MIVQSPEIEGGQSFVVRQIDHSQFSGQLALHFGNEVFAPLEPAELVMPLVAEHDQGWIELDDRFVADPNTGLPYHLNKTPLPLALPTSSLSPDRAEAQHPFIGLLSSMHSYGLFSGRYELLSNDNAGSLQIQFPPDQKRPVEELLAAELKRQSRLRDQLLANPATAHLADDRLVKRTYKALEFFDLVALYIQCEHPSRHAQHEFPHIPVDDDPANDVTITVTPLGDGRYRMSPFPFDVDPFTPMTVGRYLDPQPPGTDLQALWHATPVATQVVEFCS